MQTKVRFATGDADCSSLIYRILVACGVMPSGYHFWTGNERSLLATYGFERVNLYHPQPGDILWKEGHTEMYLGNGMQGGARLDEKGDVVGRYKGDQTGKEVNRSAFDLDYWRWEECWRYKGSKTVDGIPVPVAMYQLMNHAIDHDASHGYSQPNRDGDGGSELVTLAYDEPEPEPAPSPALVLDGRLGEKSVAEWQAQMRTVPDGIVSGQWKGNWHYFPNLFSVSWGGTGSALVMAIQRKCGCTIDGIIGPNTVKAIQRFVSVDADGYLGPETAKAIQRSLNARKWA